MENTQRTVDEFTELVERQGLHAALAYLNRRTRHRYTALYRFDPPMLRNVCLYDRENPALNIVGDSPILDTYCSIVEERVQTFLTSDSFEDERLELHPARAWIRAYCGAPVVDRNGACVGSLCHFDLRPRLVPDTEIPLLERIAGLLVEACCRNARGAQRA